MNFLWRDTESCKKYTKKQRKWWLTEKLWNSKTHKKNEGLTVYLLHFGVEVNVAVSNDELYGFISNVLVWRFHSDPPDEVHPSQIQSLHTLRETIVGFSLSRRDFPTNFTENKQESHTSCVPCLLRRWSLRFTFSKKVLKRLNPVKHWWKTTENSHTQYPFMQLHTMVLTRQIFFCGKRHSKRSGFLQMYRRRAIPQGAIMWKYCGFKLTWVNSVVELLPFIVIS